MTAPHFFLINGPPRSGKDTIAQHLVKAQPFFPNRFMMERKFADPLHDTVAYLFRKSKHFLEQNKEKPVLYGVTPRRAKIDMSEVWMKKTFGDDIFGRILVDRAVEDQINVGAHKLVYVISDSGFAVEANYLEENFPGRVHIMRLRRDGTSFAGDSRSYIPTFKPSSGNSIWLDNNGDIAETVKRAIEFMRASIKENK